MEAMESFYVPCLVLVPEVTEKCYHHRGLGQLVLSYFLSLEGKLVFFFSPLVFDLIPQGYEI